MESILVFHKCSQINSCNRHRPDIGNFAMLWVAPEFGPARAWDSFDIYAHPPADSMVGWRRLQEGMNRARATLLDGRLKKDVRRSERSSVATAR